ncbi:MAG: quinone-dependent dihydroorotate dehydrogenase [Deltaproteobacteria bacterium]|nr:quinone-dependent dihydroorotate dehydrogenase [Deltaproteobacteria bacterium]
MGPPSGIYGPLRSVAFAIDAERVHRMGMLGLSTWSRWCDVTLDEDDVARDPALSRTVFGVTFRNPLGLAAGFDKDAECLPAWQALGFGFVEVGTVTRHPQPGNDKPRLFRLPADRALLNRLGFNNHGAEACARRLTSWRQAGRVKVPVGVNLGKSKVTSAEDAAADYAFSFNACADVADYVVVNVSSPNTPGLRDLQQTEALARIVDAVLEVNAKRSTRVPLLVKVAPDLADDDAVAVARLCVERGIEGLIVSNTTIARTGLTPPIPEGPGGISGAPLFERSTALLKLLHDDVGDRIVFVGVGGVFDGETAKAKLNAGARLVQSYTGFVYGGPRFARDVVTALR